MPPVENELLTIQFVHGVGRLLHLLVVEDVNGSLANDVDCRHTIDNVPALIIALRKHCQQNVDEQDTYVECNQGVTEKQDKTSEVPLQSLLDELGCDLLCIGRWRVG